MAWVNNGNIIGQHFLLSRGFAPTAFNNSGGVCWTRGQDTEGEGSEDYIDPLEAMTTRRRRNRNYYDDECEPEPVGSYD